MEEETTDVTEDINSEVEEDTNISEDDTTDDNIDDSVTGEEDTEELQSKLDEALQAKSDLTVRAKKAEEKLKILKAKPQEETNDPQLSDELKLIARGLSDEAIEQAKVIAKGKDISLQEAIKDPLFIVFDKDLKEKQKKEEAKLGASKGSGQTQERLAGTKSGSTRDEHEEAFKKALGK